MEAPYLIAEVGMAHDGSLGAAHAYIDALAGAGVHAVKFQVHIAEAESSEHETFRIAFSYQDRTRTEYWNRTGFTADQWCQLKVHCEARKVDFLATPFSNAAVGLLESIGVSKFKVSSGDVNNLLLLQRIADTGKDIILSSGLSSLHELDDSMRFLSRRRIKVSLLQCTTAYPTRPEEWGLNLISLFKKRYCVPVGFSDHSGDIYACLAAATMGAEILEFHVVFDKAMFGPDTTSSLTIPQVAQLVRGCDQIVNALCHPVIKTGTEHLKPLKHIFEKSLAVNRALPAGHEISYTDLEGKKPLGAGIPAKQFEEIIGRKLLREMRQWEFILHENLL